MNNTFFTRYETTFMRVCALLGDGWRIDRRTEDCYRIRLINPDYRHYAIIARMEKDRIFLIGSVSGSQRGNSYDSCTVSPVRAITGIADDIKRKILINARKHIEHFETDRAGAKAQRDEKQIMVHLLSNLLDVQQYTGYYGGLCHIKSASGLSGKIDDELSAGYRLAIGGLDKTQLIKLAGFISTL
ncbi:TPA: hypothetical protein ACV5BL_004420 [Enterobacter hormaechei subsp. steigerwaltii]